MKKALVQLYEDMKMIKNKRMYYITLWIVSILIIFLGILQWWSSDTSEVYGRCSIKGIELQDIRPDECWNTDFSSKHCPIPEDIECVGKVNGFGDLIKVLITR